MSFILRLQNLGPDKLPKVSGNLVNQVVIKKNLKATSHNKPDTAPGFKNKPV